MDLLDLDGLEREADRHDRLVLECGDIDRFCSSTVWGLPAARALMPEREPWIFRAHHGYASFMRVPYNGAMLLQPLEAMWGLGCPLVGKEPLPLARELAAECRRRVPRDLLMICGITLSSSRASALAAALEGSYRLRLGMQTRRYCADLGGGIDGFLGRRSRKLRTRLRKARARARARDITFEAAPVAPESADTLFDRILAIESRSWKGREGVGIESSQMSGFYRLMLRILARRGAARVLFARHDGTDVAYILGGVFADTYRGLQFSFDADYGDYSLGNLCQLEQVTLLCEEGVGLYDLGTDVTYKQRWGEIAYDTWTLLAIPTGAG